MHPLPVQHYLPELTFEFMMDHCPVLPQFSEIMEIGQEIIQKDKAEQCLSVSLFNRSVSDVTGRTKNTPERFQVYLDGLREMLAKVSKMEGDYCVNLFLDPELSIHVPAFIRQCPKLNVFVMKHSSSAATGMFWRFLSFEKQWSMGAETVYSVDLDEDIAATLVKLAGHTPCSCVFYGPDQDLYQSRLLAARYYAPLCGALTALRPVDIELPIADTVARFLYYQTHWQMMVEPRTVYNPASARESVWLCKYVESLRDR